LHLPSRAGWHLKLTDQSSMERLETFIQEIKPVLVILDPLSNVYGGLSENDATEVARLLDQLRYLRDRYACGIMLVHHTRKGTVDDETLGQQIRGSSVFYAKIESL